MSILMLLRRLIKRVMPSLELLIFKRLAFGRQEGGSEEGGTGSGVIYKKADGKAYIVTNNHVIEGADQLEVTLADGKKRDKHR